MDSKAETENTAKIKERIAFSRAADTSSFEHLKHLLAQEQAFEVGLCQPASRRTSRNSPDRKLRHCRRVHPFVRSRSKSMPAIGGQARRIAAN
jgi:hypothetical protein